MGKFLRTPFGIGKSVSYSIIVSNKTVHSKLKKIQEIASTTCRNYSARTIGGRVRNFCFPRRKTCKQQT